MQLLVQTHSQQELLYATKYSLRTSGKWDAATMLKEMTETIPKRASKIKKAYHSPLSSVIPCTGEEVLAFFVNNNFSMQQYLNILQEARSQNCNIQYIYIYIHPTT